MIQNPISNTLFTPLIVATAMIVILFFLPALIELKKPKDAGPRIISEDWTKLIISTFKVSITDIEEQQKFGYQPTMQIVYFLLALPNMEV
jgi:hypothetical protein